MSIPEKKLTQYNEFVDALDLLDEDSRFEYIIDMGKRHRDEPFPDEARVPGNEMHGCMSRVWILHDVRDGGHFFRGDSDAIIVKGLVTMMTDSFSGLTAAELSELTLDHVRRLNLGALTMQRQVGMMAMLKHMQKLSGRHAGARPGEDTGVSAGAAG